MDEYFCPNCGAVLNDQFGFDPSCGSWTCTCCGIQLLDDDVYEGDIYEGIAWYCDVCGALLNRQTGFSDLYDSWICTECGHSNSITDNEIYESREDYERQRNNSDDVSPTKDVSDSLAGFFSTIIEDGATAYPQKRKREREEEAKRQAQEERIRQEKEDKRKAKNALRKKRAIAFLLRGKQIEIHYDCEELIGKSVSFVVSALTENAFSNIKTIPIKDIYKNSEYVVGQVEQVVIGGSSFFRENDWIPYDIEIIITYHDKKQIAVPFSEHSLRKLNYVLAGAKLQELGFIEIYEKPIRDLITGWVKKDGTIEKITIGGVSPFKKGSIFEYDVEIIIEYHTFKKN